MMPFVILLTGSTGVYVLITFVAAARMIDPRSYHHCPEWNVATVPGSASVERRDESL